MRRRNRNSDDNLVSSADRAKHEAREQLGRRIPSPLADGGDSDDQGNAPEVRRRRRRGDDDEQVPLDELFR